MNDTTQHVLELLERIQELEEERDTLTEVKDALLGVAERFVKERNAALEGKDILQGLAERYIKEHQEELRVINDDFRFVVGERDAALERVRALESVLIVANSLISGAKSRVAALETVVADNNKRWNEREKLAGRDLLELEQERDAALERVRALESQP